MPDSIITLPDYTVETVIESDSFMIHYSAVNPNGQLCIATEFFPTYMAKRAETGEIEVSDNNKNEYAGALKKFTTLAKAQQSAKEASLSPITELITHNNTAYAIRPVNPNPSLETYLGGQTLPAEEAYSLLQPLLGALAHLERRGLFFKITPQNLRVDANSSLVADCLFTLDLGMSVGNAAIARLYYDLITDPNREETGAEPSELEAFLLETLTSENPMGSINDFYRRVRAIVAPKSTWNEREQTLLNDVTYSRLKAALAILSVVLLLIIVGQLLFWIILPLNRTDEIAGSNPPAWTPPHEPTDYSAFALTNPNDASDVLNGGFCYYNGTLYYRSYRDGYMLSKRDSDGTVTVLARDVRPAFITVKGGFIYYTDGLSNYRMYRLALNGSEPERIAGYNASFLQVDGGYAFFTNHDDMNRLYWLDLKTGEAARYINAAAYETCIQNGVLYFVNGSQNFNIYAVDLKNADASPTRLNEACSDNLRVSGDLLYYIDLLDSQIKCISLEGEEIELKIPLQARAFEIEKNYMAIIEFETQKPYGYDMETGELTPLSGISTAYLYPANGTVNALDYDDCRIARRYQQP